MESQIQKSDTSLSLLSEPMKLLSYETHDLGAQWIWPGLQNYDLHNRFAVFRKSFDLPSKPKIAKLCITADQSYRLWINAHCVASGPARGFHGNWPLDEIDVAEWLKAGSNVLAVRVHHPGNGTFSYISKDTAGLLVSLQAGKKRIVSDATWRCRFQNGVRRDVVPLCAQLSYQEHIDLQEEPTDWMQHDYDDSSYSPPGECKPWNALPWETLQERGIPMLDETVILTPSWVGQAEGVCLEGWRETRDVFLHRYLEGLHHEPGLVPEDSFIKVEKTGAHRWKSYLLDFGKVQFGRALLCILDAQGGELVDLCFYETLAPGSIEPDVAVDSNSKIAMGMRATLRPGDQEHEFFHPVGFRYAVVTVRGAQRPLRLRLRLRSTLYPLEITGSFRSSETDLNAIWDACVWTQRVCCADAYVDTPWREQAQWWGDARVQAQNTFHLSGDARLLRRGIACISQQRTSNGLTWGHAPTKGQSSVLPDFSITWLLTLWDHYWQTGSLEAFVSHEATVRGVLEYFAKWTDEQSGLIRADPRHWLFLDWSDLPKTGCPSLLSLLCLDAFEKVARLYSKSGHHTAARELQRRSRLLRIALRKLLRSDGLFSDGLKENATPYPTASIHAQTLALGLNLSPKSAKVMTQKRILPFLQKDQSDGATPSAFWCTYVFSEAARRGYGRDVVDFTRRRWKEMAQHGSTWETFHPRRGDESFSHAWSAHPLHHLMQIVGGIRQTSPAWESISVAPELVGDSCKVSIPTPHGEITLEWQRSKAATRYHLRHPRQIKSVIPRSPQGKGHSWTITTH